MKWLIILLLSLAVSAQSLDLPEALDNVPGQGPIRHDQQWFRDIWRSCRQMFRETAAQDRCSVVFLGDSITQGWGEQLKTAFPHLRTCNRGISGDTSRGILVRLQEDVLALEPSAIVLQIGTNDVADGATAEQIAGNVELILAAAGDTPVILCAVFPSSPKQSRPTQNVRDLNRHLRELSLKFKSVSYVDTWTLFANGKGEAKPEEFPDLVHPNQLGYAKWAQALRSPLAALKLP